MNTISIITSMYNRNPQILETIDNLLIPSLLSNGNSEMELIIIDDCSPLEDATGNLIGKHFQTLKEKFGNVIFTRNESNLGFAKNFNTGLYKAGGERIILANDDLYFPLNSIARLVQTLDEQEGYLIAGPITNASGAWSFQYCKQAPLLSSYEPAEIVELEKFSLWLYEKMRGQIMTTDNLCGFCYATDAAFLRELNGFDEKYGHGFFEDTDLIQRIAKEYGKSKIAINMEVFVGHGGVKGSSQTMSQELLKMNYYFFANAIKYANRWGYWKLLRRIVYGIQSQTGKGTISELLPENVAL